MNNCIIADFEWCITPHPLGGERFLYYNEILSAGAVRINENGDITDRFYQLVRPVNAAYLHPVILHSLRLDREALSAAEDFPAVYRAFCTFIEQTPIFSWGCADQSALTQNLRFKGVPDQKELHAPTMHDLQPILCKGLQIPCPYPSLATVLAHIGLSNDENRHNALSDAEDTAKIVAEIAKRSPAALSALFPINRSISKGTEKPLPSEASSDTLYPSVRDCFCAARKLRRKCPVCDRAVGIGTWILGTQNTLTTICSCEKDGKFLCTVKAVPSVQSPGQFFLHTETEPFEAEQKKRYCTLRRASRAKTFGNP